MGSTFNPQILVDKLTKLNNSQQSIETLSHWCIFHMNKAKLVVETWERQFHSSPRDQRLAFLYLANDILQNSRRKGAEFVAEFWRVLPEALREVIRNGDDFGKNAARRLINIWDERKVFGSRGHILKEEFMGRQPENNKSGRPLGIKRQSGSDMVDKIVSDYEAIYGGQSDEDVLLSRCSNAITGLEKVVKDVGSRVNAGQLNESGLGEELRGKHAALRECIEQLTSLETSRAILVSHLREALQEQELKLDQLRTQLQAAQLQSEQAANLCQQFVGPDSRHDQSSKESHYSSSATPPGFSSGDQKEAAPVVYKRQAPSLSEDDFRKSTAAAVAAQLAASTASAEMLSHVLTSLVSGGIIDRTTPKDASVNDREPSEKKPKLEDGDSPYTPPPPPPPPPGESQIPPPPPLPPFPHPDSLQQNTSSTNQQTSPGKQQTPPSSNSSPPQPMPLVPPLLPPYHPMFLQSAGPMSNVSYTYGSTQMPPLPLPATYTPVGPPFVPPPVSQYQNYQTSSEGAFYSPSSSVPVSSISHQQSL